MCAAMVCAFAADRDVWTFTVPVQQEPCTTGEDSQPLWLSRQDLHGPVSISSVMMIAVGWLSACIASVLWLMPRKCSDWSAVSAALVWLCCCCSCRYLESNRAVTRRKREEAKKLRESLRDLQCQLDRLTASRVSFTIEIAVSYSLLLNKITFTNILHRIKKYNFIKHWSLSITFHQLWFILDRRLTFVNYLVYYLLFCNYFIFLYYTVVHQTLSYLWNVTSVVILGLSN